MKTLLLSLTIGAICITSAAWSQNDSLTLEEKLGITDEDVAEDEEENEEWINPDKDYQWPIVSASFGFLTYRGDIADSYSFIQNGRLRFSLTLSAEKRLWKYFGASGHFMYGSVGGSRHTRTEFNNFESSIVGGWGSFQVYTDQIWPAFPLSAFASVGVGLFGFNPYGDLLDAQGRTYYQWDDGQLRDLPQDNVNGQIPNILTRDYVYETQLDTVGAYSKVAAFFPITAGIKWQMHKYWDVRLALTYFFTTTDRLDHVASGGITDGFANIQFTLGCNLTQFKK